MDFLLFVGWGGAAGDKPVWGSSGVRESVGELLNGATLLGRGPNAEGASARKRGLQDGGRGEGGGRAGGKVRGGSPGAAEGGGDVANRKSPYG